MNNRQAALIAASGLTATPWGKAPTTAGVMRKMVDNARVLELWLLECDAADAEGRAADDFDSIVKSARGW